MTRRTPDRSSSRRHFLHGSAAAGAALFAGPLALAADAVDLKAKPQPKAKADPTESLEDSNPNSAAASTAANSGLNIALIGAGGRGRGVMKELLFSSKEKARHNVYAVCDPDLNQLAAGIKDGGEFAKEAKGYTDYRKLLEDAKDIDAVIIGTPDHWHAPLCKAFIKAGKHVYCEKPLTRTLGEARELRELAGANPKIVTQLGNQGSAEPSLRRSIELIRAGVLGQIREVHAWLSDVGPGKERPAGEDPIPSGFNWDYWCGPSPYRPYKAETYHPGKWRGWFDFGGGPLADFTCHIFNTALRSLDLTYATRIEVQGQALAKESYANNTHLKMHFPARKQSDSDRQLDPVIVHWYDGGQRPSDEMLKDVIDVYKTPPKHGSLFIGEKGIIWTNPWNQGALIKLTDDPKLKDITLHEPTQHIPITLPRKVGHVQEWVNAIRGQGTNWSPFEFGGHLTEIGLAGVLGVRVGHDLDWDGQAQIARNAPEAAAMIKPTYRKAWMV